MTNRAIVLVLAVVLVCIGAWIYFSGSDFMSDGGTPTGQDGTNGGTGGNNGGTGGTNTGGNSGGTSSGGTTNPLVRNVSPAANAIVSSPLTVTGEARGNWYFEASAPMRIVDANGRQLGISYVQAQGEWMTTDFVPFRGTINFTTPTTPTGFLILEKDNPSGLPENAAEVRIPVRFNTSTSQTRAIRIYNYDESRDKDSGGNVLCSAKGLVAAERTIPFTNTPIQDAVRELLRVDPDFSGVSLTSASLSGGVLTLTFNDPQNRTSGGSCKVSVLRAQVEATAKQFGGVSTVRYAPQGVFEP